MDGNGKPTQNKVECVVAANLVFVNIGSEQDGVALTLSAGDKPTLEDLTLGTVDGLPLSYHDSDPGLKPTITKVGSTYRIVGVATSPDGSGGHVSKPFDMEFTCPPRR